MIARNETVIGQFNQHHPGNNQIYNTSRNHEPAKNGGFGSWWFHINIQDIKVKNPHII